MKNWTKLAATVAVSALVLAGCSGEEADPGTTDPGTTEPDATTGSPDGTAAPDDDGTSADLPEGPVTLSISENAAVGGKNAATAEWITEDVIPSFESMMEEQGVDVTVEFVPAASGDEDYKTRLALDLRSGAGPDVIGFDQFWVAEFDAADYAAPLAEIVGPEIEDWEGWDAIPEAVQGSFVLNDQKYGIPFGTDGRVIYYRKDLFEQAGLPTDWQPTSWQDIIDAGRTLQEELPDVTPLQFNAGVSYGEATTLQGFVPILLGAGVEPYQDDAWTGATEAMTQALGFYDTIFGEGLADTDLQLLANGREQSFEQFANGQIAVLAEGDYFWRSVIAPDGGQFPVENVEDVVGYAKIPAMEPGAGIRGQDFVSASGGTGRILNPNTEAPQVAWELMKWMGSEEMVSAFAEREPRITARTDVNETALQDQPMLQFISDEVLPITWYRPGFETYPQVSTLIQETVESVARDRATAEKAASSYESELQGIVGADNVSGG